MKMLEKICKRCGVNYETYKSNRIFCSEDCYFKSRKEKSAKNRTAICEYCNSSFLAWTPHDAKTRKYCSWKCSSESRKELQIRKNCPICGKFYYRKSSKTCSLPCGYKYIKQVNEEKRIYKECPICSIKFYSFNKTCGKECGKILAIKNHKDTIMQLYGVTNVSQIDFVKEKKKSKGYAVIVPNFNPAGCRLIDKYNKKDGYEFQHAMNGGEVQIGGYFPDGLDEKRKTIIEIDEKQHYTSDGELKEKDKKRQEYLENLGYKVIRIKIWEVDL